MKKIFYVGLILSTGLLAGCISGDDNDVPRYGKQSGLPSNCRAYVQFAIDEYRAGKHTANATMAGLERNCGANGSTWKK